MAVLSTRRETRERIEELLEALVGWAKRFKKS
jgi:hypothetical protein